MRKRPAAQQILFVEDPETSQRPLLQPALREKVMPLMVLWMQAVAEALDREVEDEQDHL